MSDTGPVIAALDLKGQFKLVAEVASTLANCLDAPLQLVTVYDETRLGAINEFGMGLNKTLQLEEKELSEELQLRQIIEQRLGLEGEAREQVVILESPKVAQKLVEHAESTGASMIVMGQPRSRFGSVAVAVSRNAPCDVHIVRTEGED
ncbi:MAG: universal stress protein [Gammaproteobacteria bacterium]|nr:MAG: universal stress protein [Gammaproteobacteria bacterium]